MKVFVLLVCVAFSALSRAQEGATQTYDLPDGRQFIYSKPEALHVVTGLPDTALLSLKQAFTKETLWPWVGIIGSTWLLVEYDEDILLDVQKHGRELGIGNEEKTKTVLEAGDIKLLRLPSDLGSAMYFLGDGWTHFGIAGGFLAYGYFKTDYRAWNTAYQLVHGMAVSTVFNQALKRSTGRESPNERSTSTGKWRLFPPIKSYNEHTAKYDAMPSGHVMTSTLVMTVINENYPEYSHITLPLGVTLISTLGWQMVNNGVHWASDYPLAVAMGLFYGKLVAANWKFKKTKESEVALKSRNPLYNFELSPMMTYHEALGLNVTWEF